MDLDGSFGVVAELVETCSAHRLSRDLDIQRLICDELDKVKNGLIDESKMVVDRFKFSLTISSILASFYALSYGRRALLSIPKDSFSFAFLAIMLVMMVSIGSLVSYEIPPSYFRSVGVIRSNMQLSDRRLYVALACEKQRQIKELIAINSRYRMVASICYIFLTYPLILLIFNLW